MYGFKRVGETKWTLSMSLVYLYNLKYLNLEHVWEQNSYIYIFKLIISIYVSTEKQPRIVVTRKICPGPVPPAELPPGRRARASNLRLGWRGVVLVRAGGRAEAAGRRGHRRSRPGPGRRGGGGDIMSTSFVIFSSTPPPLLLHPDTADTNKITIPTTCPQLRCPLSSTRRPPNVIVL